ncbi:MAG: hypothetical protein KGY50_03780 [Candidatus Thermoplasmatota archaeon]|nr:hypothetical protein [Candidatus Thermoplasmatota archaeon]
MSEAKKEGGEPDAADFDLQLELSSLVADNVIPQSIAERLGKKLVEKQVDITKDQLYALAEKIHSFIESYKENGSLPEPSSVEQSVDTPKVQASEESEVESADEIEKSDSLSSESMDSETVEEFMNKIEELQQKIDMLEQETKMEDSQDELDQQQQGSSADDFQIPYDESVSTDHLTSDPLQSIPANPESIIVLMNWLQYLVNRCGHDHLSQVLDYYVEVDWITDDVKISLLEYSTGITEGKDVKADSSSRKKEEKTAHLHSKDHIQSYLYIQRLKGKKFEKHFVERINGELARIEKKVDTYHHTQ